MKVQPGAYAAALALLGGGLYPFVAAGPTSLAALAAAATWVLGAFAPFLRAGGVVLTVSLFGGLGVLVLAPVPATSEIGPLAQACALVLGWEGLDAQRRIAVRRRGVPGEDATWVVRFTWLHTRQIVVVAGLAAATLWALAKAHNLLLEATRLPRFAESVEASSFLGLWLAALVVVAVPLVAVSLWPSMHPWSILAVRIARRLRHRTEDPDPNPLAAPPPQEVDIHA